MVLRIMRCINWNNVKHTSWKLIKTPFFVGGICGLYAWLAIGSTSIALLLQACTIAVAVSSVNSNIDINDAISVAIYGAVFFAAGFAAGLPVGYVIYSTISNVFNDPLGYTVRNVVVGAVVGAVGSIVSIIIGHHFGHIAYCEFKSVTNNVSNAITMKCSDMLSKIDITSIKEKIMVAEKTLNHIKYIYNNIAEIFCNLAIPLYSCCLYTAAPMPFNFTTAAIVMICSRILIGIVDLCYNAYKEQEGNNAYKNVGYEYVVPIDDDINFINNNGANIINLP